ncbi:MAG: hypothetical protein AB7F35_01790 [Acetobacteraceae bacterium]
MAADLKKFVNPKFLRTVNLPLLRELFARQPEGHRGMDLGAFNLPDPEARSALAAFFQGPEDQLSRGIVADLHHIAELGTENGMNLLHARAEARGVEITPPLDIHGQPIPLDPKQFAIFAFLRHRGIFDAVSDLLAREARSSFTEYVGEDEGIEPLLTETAREAFENGARDMFRRNYRGAYCRVGWYEDGAQTVLVVTHGSPVSVVPVIAGDQEDVISYRSQAHAVLAYHPGTGRLGISGVPKAQRAELVETFAQQILHRPGFFAGEDCQDLYTLERAEQIGTGFIVNHDFDPMIQRIEIVEVQLDRLGTEVRPGEPVIEACHLVKDFRGNALRRAREFNDRISFGPGRYRLGHMTIRVHFAAGSRVSKVTVKVKPPSHAIFKRQRFEQRVMELLRRNGFCRERRFGEAAAAAE